MNDQLTVSDLQQMKRDGKKIAAAVVYEYQMARICEEAGADLLSVGDSVGRTFLGQGVADELTVEEMLPFARAVIAARRRAVVSVDMPTATCKAGPVAVEKAARLLRDEIGANMTKVDIRELEEELFDVVRAVVETGFVVYPQIGFQVGGEPHNSAADREHVFKWAHAVEDAGASILDLTNVSHEIYAEVSKSLRIPVIGGQTGSEADGRIYVSYALVGYRAERLSADDQLPNAAKYMYDVAKAAIGNVHAGSW